LTVKNINHRLEQLIDSLSIKNGKETYLKNQIKYLLRGLKKVSLYDFEYPHNNIQTLSNHLGITRFWYCGSYDRGVCIDTEFDIDIDIVYDDHPNKHEIEIAVDSLTGEILFTFLYEDLLEFQNKVNAGLNIIKTPPFSHAIPVSLDYQQQTLLVDCIPALELPNGYLIVPDGWEDIKKVNQILEEKGLSKVNKKTNGSATKLIWLLKYWNWYWNKPLKSYVIQRLVEEIFKNRAIKNWSTSVQVFFNHSINILDKYYNNQLVLKDRVYTQKTILDDYNIREIEKFYESLHEAKEFAIKGEWNELFGNV